MRLHNRFCSILLVICLLVAVLPLGVNAAYDGAVPTSGNGAVYYNQGQAVLYVNNAQWADAHYKINNGTDINVRMEVDSSGQNTLLISGLSEGDVISYWFTVYTTYATDVKGFEDYVHTAPSQPAQTDAYVFKVGSTTAHSVLYGSFEIDSACQYVNGVTYVPFRIIATVAGAKNVVYDASAATVTIVNNYDITFVLRMNSTAVNVIYADGSAQASSINSAPIYIDGKACLPVRDTSNITFASIEYVEQASEGYVVVSTGEMSSSKAAEYVARIYEIGGETGGNTGGNTNPLSRFNNSNTTDTALPVLRTDIPKGGQMVVQLNNNTGGAYADSEIYWCIIGKDPATDNYCYVNSAGQLIPCTTALNTIAKGDRMCADICYSLAQSNYVYMPNISSGRMYFSYGDRVYITINVDGNGNIGYAGPDLNNTSDPNRDVLFEFIEFTVTDGVYWGNTTRVDFFSFPIVTRLVGTGGFVNAPGDADVYDMTVGDVGTRAEIFSAFSAQVPDKFKTLVTDKRILAPCKYTFNEGGAYANYFDGYINEFWTKYSNNPFTFNCDAGQFTCYTSGNYLYFTAADGRTGTVAKPTTQDVLEGKGTLASGTSVELVVEAQMCAAFNRGVATQPENWGNADAYYKNGNCNYYSGFWHEHSVDAFAYGFCYDDVFDHSTLLHYTKPEVLVVDLRW